MKRVQLVKLTNGMNALRAAFHAMRAEMERSSMLMDMGALSEAGRKPFPVRLESSVMKCGKVSPRKPEWLCHLDAGHTDHVYGTHRHITYVRGEAYDWFDTEDGAEP